MVSNIVYKLGFASFNFPFAAVLSLIAVILTIVLLLVIHVSTRRLEKMSLH